MLRSQIPSEYRPVRSEILLKLRQLNVCPIATKFMVYNSRLHVSRASVRLQCIALWFYHACKILIQYSCLSYVSKGKNQHLNEPGLRFQETHKAAASFLP